MTIPQLITQELSWRRNPPPVTPESLFADLDLCQLERLCIASAIEERHYIDLPDAEIEAWQSVADVARSVATRRVAA